MKNIEPRKKTLIVSYIPRKKQSNTKKLLDAFRGEVGIYNVDELDLPQTNGSTSRTRN